MDTAGLTRYIEVRDARAALSAQDRKLKDEQEALAEQIIDNFTQEGISSLNIRGRCVYVSRSEKARPAGGDHVAAVRALFAAGMDQLVTLGSQKMSAFLRATPPEGRDAALMAAWEVYESCSVGCRKAGE